MTVEAAMAAMRTAEQEADFNARFDDTRNSRWARDRLRLIARDRATLERHRERRWADGGGTTCGECVGVNDWPCPDAQCVIGYWQEDA